ncbi:MAG TPA: hypothetical protein VML55_03365, partial [Planctomycetaceae bacterium]|nr:hypothetical protein [Planctomycetaceae bacterium]
MKAALTRSVRGTFFEQVRDSGRRVVVHLFNNINTTGQHGLPAAEVPLREETVPIGGIRVVFSGDPPRACRWEPDGGELPLKPSRAVLEGVEVEVPPL